MAKRRLEELNLLDNFLFGSMMNDERIRERFGQILLEIIFGRKFGHLRVSAQKELFGNDTDKHGARLDVYFEEDITGAWFGGDGQETVIPGGEAVYDVEPEKDSKRRAVAALPKRVRFYHAKITGDSLSSGQDYDALKNVVVVMITPFDPFGLNRMVYTIRSTCVEEPGMLYEDGARTLFLYTKGKRGEAPEELRALLRYMEHTCRENACTEKLREIQAMVEYIKKDKGVREGYMRMMRDERVLRAEGIEIGMKRGIERGIEQERQNTERERQRAEKQRREAEQAKQRAEMMEKENARLREALERLGG